MPDRHGGPSSSLASTLSSGYRPGKENTLADALARREGIEVKTSDQRTQILLLDEEIQKERYTKARLAK